MCSAFRSPNEGNRSGLKFGISGADSTGKTTLAHAVETGLRALGKVVRVMSIGDIARQCPFPVIRSQNVQASNWIMQRIVEAESSAMLSCDCLLCDRTALDIWCFGKMAHRGVSSNGDFELFHQRIQNWLPSYSVIFVTFIDSAIPVRISNVPNGDVTLRDEFEAVLREGINVFHESCCFQAVGSDRDLAVASVVDSILSL